MNRVLLPVVDDAAAIKKTSNNKRLKGYPQLKPAVGAVIQRYTQYMQGGGYVAPATAPAIVSLAQAAILKSLFRKPPKSLKHITDLRKNTAHLSCPMCGSFQSGTLDHLLPQTSYPEYIVFAPNLVYACTCNSKRGVITTGANPGERILHPYFDDCLSRRLVTVRIRNWGNAPSISICLTADALNHEQASAIGFHLESIVMKTPIIGYLTERWADLCRRPPAVFRFLSDGVASIQELRKKLREERELLDYEHRNAKNNWRSVFATGVLEPPTTRWLFSRLQIPGRTANDPLVD